MSDKRAARQSMQASLSAGGVASALLRAERALQAGDTTSAERELCAVLAADSSWPEAHYLLGEVARQRGQPAAAEKSYRAAIERDARVASFHHALGNVLQDAGRLEDAIRTYRRALRLAPEMAEAWNDLGTAYFASGQQLRAADCYRKALAQAPGNIAAWSNLGATLRAGGDVRGALRAYRRELWQRLLGLTKIGRRSRLSLADAAERWLSRGSIRVSLALAEAALSQHPADPDALAVMAQIAQHNGESSKAVALLEQAVRESPKRSHLWVALGLAHRSAGQHEQAVAALRAAASAGERSAGLRRVLALSLAASGAVDEAIDALERLTVTANDVETWTALGRVRLDQGNWPGAEQALECAVSLQPSFAAALAQLARLRLAQQNIDEALAFCEQALQSDPACAEAHYWRGRGLGSIGRWVEAGESFGEALSLDVSSAAFARWHAIALRASGRLDESQAVLRDALARHPGNFDLRSELVISIYEGGNVPRARQALEQLLAENPNHARATAAMSGLLNAEGRLQESEIYARRALSIEASQPMAHQNLGIALLKLGRYSEGWDHFEWRMKVDEFVSVYRRFPYREWDGTDLAGKTILVYAEQGLGDEIMFASCLPDLARQAERVVLECEPRLGQLFARSFRGCAVFARQRTQANAWTRSLEPQPDVQIAIGSLARHFRRRPDDFPNHDGYLKADASKVERWRSWLGSLGTGRKFGVSWRGGLVKTGTVRRSLSLDELAPILKREGTRFVSLQYGSVQDELAAFERLRGIRVHHTRDVIDDYDECAALICALDGVVSVCTSVVHLTGALGRPGLVMAPYSPEWRYGMTGEAMPWYPSIRVLRQPSPGEWAPVLAQVKTALEDVAG